MAWLARRRCTRLPRQCFRTMKARRRSRVSSPSSGMLRPPWTSASAWRRVVFKGTRSTTITSVWAGGKSAPSWPISGWSTPATTDATGLFRFPEWPFGVYRFWEIWQNGWAPVTSPEFEVPVLEPGDQCLTIRFKNRQVTPVPVPTNLPVSYHMPIISLADGRSATPAPIPIGAGCVTGARSMCCRSVCRASPSC